MLVETLARKLKLLGTVSQVFQDKIIARMESGNIPSLGVNVYNKGQEHIGKLQDIIGPRELPWLAIRPSREVKTTIGDEIFLLKMKPRKNYPSSIPKKRRKHPSRYDNKYKANPVKDT